MKLTLLLDMDGPLADFDRRAYDLAVDAGCVFDHAGPHEQRHRYSHDHLVDIELHKPIMRALVEAPGFFRELEPTPGAIEGARELMEHFDVWVCSKPLEASPTCRDEKGAWLREHFPELEAKLILAPDKSMIRGDILLDDAPKLSWLERAEWAPVVFDMPFNGSGSKWVGLPHWTWGDPVDSLVLAAEKVQAFRDRRQVRVRWL